MKSRGLRSGRDTAKVVAALLRNVSDEVREQLGTDPCVGIQQHFGVPVVIRNETVSAGTCAVDGTYQPPPSPRISVAASLSRGRQHFSALHELGHHLCRTSDELIEEMWKLGDAGEDWEEDIADGVAASLLFNEAVLAEHLPAHGPPTARQVADLHGDVHASREATCVAVARRLTAEGYVALADRDCVVRIVAPSQSAYPVPRSGQRAFETLVQAALTSGSASRRELRLTYRGGTQTKPMAVTFVEADGYVFAVLAVETAPWARPRAKGVDTTCPDCGHRFEVYGTSPRCERCQEPRCPTCDGCACGQPTLSASDRMCSECMQTKGPVLFDSPEASICVDCL